VRDVVLAMITKLKADTPVSTVVLTRVYRRNLPANPTFPAITVTRIDKIRDDDTSTGRYAHARIQCTAWAADDGTAENLSELIANCLHRTTNTILTAGTSNVYVVSVKDAGGVPDENTDLVPPIYMEHRDFMIHYDYR
jgi:hypothetical protein